MPHLDLPKDASVHEPTPHAIRWTPELVGRFWDWFSGWSDGQTFFSKSYGHRVIAFAGELTDLRGKDVLDFGTGPGWLIDGLLDEGARASGVELSEELIRVATDRLQGREGFGGVHFGRLTGLPFDDGSFDVVFATEVVEHLLDEEVDPFFTEMRRVLRSGGLLVLTTPNAEDLASKSTLCPECGAIFHSMQHVQTWSTRSLPARAASFGFRTASVRAVWLALDSAPEIAVHHLKRLVRPASRRQPPNLLFAGRAV